MHNSHILEELKPPATVTEEKCLYHLFQLCFPEGGGPKTHFCQGRVKSMLPAGSPAQGAALQEESNSYHRGTSGTQLLRCYF